MADIYKSIFQDEILVHIEVRRQELGREAFRHYVVRQIICSC